MLENQNSKPSHQKKTRYAELKRDFTKTAFRRAGDVPTASEVLRALGPNSQPRAKKTELVIGPSNWRYAKLDKACRRVLKGGFGSCNIAKIAQ